MSDMSRAIRLQLESHGKSLQDIPLQTLREFTQIVGAFYLDLKAELDRRLEET
jgi:hypothetical protein